MLMGDTIRQLQLRGALCLAAFCKHFDLEHAAISDLLKHLLSLLTNGDLPLWEKQGATLALTGRGDPLPAGLNSQIPSGIRDDFVHLVDCTVEIGLVDLFSDTTDQPARFLSKCLAILSRCNVQTPVFGGSTLEQTQHPSWGEIISQDDLRRMLAPYASLLPPSIMP